MTTRDENNSQYDSTSVKGTENHYCIYSGQNDYVNNVNIILSILNKKMNLPDSELDRKWTNFDENGTITGKILFFIWTEFSYNWIQ